MSCIVETHKNEPFHWADIWAGQYFRKIDLSHMGMRIYLGHEGLRCPALTERSVGSRLTILDTNGIHECTFFFCECMANVGPHSQVLQLLHHRLFPYTTIKPETAVTFRCLHDFHLHTNTSRKSVYDYMKMLYRRTSDEMWLNTSVRGFSLPGDRVANSHLVPYSTFYSDNAPLEILGCRKREWSVYGH